MTPLRHRWLRFSLRTLFVVVTACAVALGCLTWQMSISYQRKKAIGNLPEGTYFVRYSEFGPSHVQPPLSTAARFRRLLGDEPVEFIWIPSAEYATAVASLRQLFPEADFGEGDHRFHTTDATSS